MISKVSILGDKAVIKQNKFGVWQFRMWISSEKKYVEKSLRTKKKTDAVDLAEELYIQLRNELANGKTLFAPTYAEAMQCLGPLKLCHYLLTKGVTENGTETVFG